MSETEIREQVVNIVLQSTILIDTIDKLEETGAEKFWLRDIKQTGRVFREKLINYTTRQRHLYNDDTYEAFFQSLLRVEEYSKIFSLIFEEFLQFCKETEYMQRKGVTKFSLHIDRIVENRGYTYDNIQALTNTDNIEKYLKWRDRDISGKNIFTVEMGVRVGKESDDCPF